MPGLPVCPQIDWVGDLGWPWLGGLGHSALFTYIQTPSRAALTRSPRTGRGAQREGNSNRTPLKLLLALCQHPTDCCKSHARACMIGALIFISHTTSKVCFISVCILAIYISSVNCLFIYCFYLLFFLWCLIFFSEKQGPNFLSLDHSFIYRGEMENKTTSQVIQANNICTTHASVWIFQGQILIWIISVISLVLCFILWLHPRKVRSFPLYLDQRM